MPGRVPAPQNRLRTRCHSFLETHYTPLFQIINLENAFFSVFFVFHGFGRPPERRNEGRLPLRTGRKVIQVTKKGEDKYTKKSLQTIKYKQGGEDPATSKKSVTLEARDGVEYYVSVKATNIKKTSVDPKTYYNVTYAIDTHEAASLTMPETSDILAMTDSLSLGNYTEDTLATASMSSFVDLNGSTSLPPLATLA